VIENIQKLSMVQLDTGYTDHSKVKNSFDLDRDEDFIDEDHDAKDEMKGYVHPLQYPRHGTRTASLVTGTSIKPTYANDGNAGILTLNDKSLIKLIPYRISRSPILIGREKDLAASAYVAIERNTDVMFLCMGSYPRPMLAKVARHAYERGVIWVCAAGNEVRLVVSPALYPGTIAVAAINPENKAWRGSSRGLSVDISAPGEDVYVPRVDGKAETMSFGSGTSYSTPHVASAAVLWKARHYNELNQKYTQPWQIVEAFRYCLKQSANREHWENSAKFGAGLLDITKLLETPLPEAFLLEHAYNNSDTSPETRWNLRTLEEVHNAWQHIGNSSDKIRSDVASDEELLLKEYFESYEPAPKVQIFEE
jgi:endonuclease G